jgi:hypothetical protein
MGAQLRSRKQEGPGQPPKETAEVRKHVRASSFNDAEDERIAWAAQEVGLPVAVFMRMASLKMAKEILG